MMARKKNDDISNKVVVLMLVAFILVSVVSLGVYMDALQNDVNIKVPSSSVSSTHGVASLQIGEPTNLLSNAATESVASIRIIDKQ
jgi:cell division protein FtsL